ncbi:MAG: SDR family NAD(P)-dependent oxidoreductase [Actinomycetota bacterium]|jgi:short-subunit dehydrogenase
MKVFGKVAVVTGAASGIGLSMTKRFIAEGMSVAMVDIEEEKLKLAANELRSGGGDVLAFVCDVSDKDQVATMRDAVVSAFGTVHVLCNNAGVASGRRITREKPESWDWVVGVNLLGVAYCIHAFVGLMTAQGEGHIVNTASEAGLASSPMLGSYHATKYAVVGLSESLSMELEGTGVGVTCLCPELVNTKIFESSRNAPASLGLTAPEPIPISAIEELMGTTAMNPDDVAGRVLYAIEAQQFWVITHQVTHSRLLRRNDDLAHLRAPRYHA